MHNTTKVIGSRELVSFVNQKIDDVPAKIDTGADSSAVWATDVFTDNKTLSFKLFGRGSKYYTGEVITTSEFSVTSVKNSFGVTEKRYKTKLTLKLGDKKIAANVNLSDRSSNKYPILIGRKTISKKFHVDVSLNNITKDRLQKILILNCKDHQIVRDFTESLNVANKNIHCDFSTFDDLIIEVDTNKLEVSSIRNNTSVKNYDLVYFKTHFARQEFAKAITEQLVHAGVDFIDTEVNAACSNTKVSQYAKLARHGLPVPKTIMINNSILSECYELFKSKLGSPFILKDPSADKGLRNYFISDNKDFEKAVKKTPKEQKYSVAQKYIKNDGDYRLLVFDKSVKMIIHRKSTSSSTHLNNTSTGGVGTLIDPKLFSPALKTIAIESAVVFDRQVAGVDLIKDLDTNDWYILEINNSPQIASGSYVKEKHNIFSKFLENYSKK